MGEAVLDRFPSDSDDAAGGLWPGELVGAGGVEACDDHRVEDVAVQAAGAEVCQGPEAAWHAGGPGRGPGGRRCCQSQSTTAVNAPGQRDDPGVTVIMGGVGLAIVGVALIVLVLRMLLAQAVARDVEAAQMQAELDEVI